MTWMGDVPHEIEVAGLSFLMAGELLDEVEPRPNEFGIYTDRPSVDWAASACFALARAQLDQMMLLLESQTLDVSARHLSGQEVTRRLLQHFDDLPRPSTADDADVVDPAEDFKYAASCIGEAVDLWRALSPERPFVVRHGFQVDGSITITTGPDLPECGALGIRAGDGELETSPRYVQEVALGVMRDVISLIKSLEGSKRSPGRGNPGTSGEKQDAALDPTPADAPEGAGDLKIEGSLEEFANAFALETQVWASGFEVELISHLAGLLGRRGLLRSETIEEVSLAKARIACLCLLHVEFCARSGEGTPGDWKYKAPFLESHFTDEEQVLLGQMFDLGVMESEGEDDEEWIWLTDGFMQEVARGVRREVVAVLKEELENWLVAYFWATRLEDVVYPLPGELVSDIVNEDVWEKLDAHQWIEDGMDLPAW